MHHDDRYLQVGLRRTCVCVPTPIICISGPPPAAATHSSWEDLGRLGTEQLPHFTTLRLPPPLPSKGPLVTFLVSPRGSSRSRLPPMIANSCLRRNTAFLDGTGTYVIGGVRAMGLIHSCLRTVKWDFHEGHTLWPLGISGSWCPAAAGPRTPEQGTSVQGWDKMSLLWWRTDRALLSLSLLFS